MIKICRDCGHEFDTQAKKTLTRAGFIDQCAKCSVKSGDNDLKYLGRPGATLKGANIEIFRENLATIKQVIKGENARGFTANLSLGSPVSACVNQECDDSDFDRSDKPKGYNGNPGKVR
jgi:hypothetical protein